MANTLQVYQTLAREAAAIFEENAPFVSHVNRAREDDFARKYDEYKPGATVNIKIPPTATVYTGANFAGGGASEDTVEQTVPLTFSDATDRKHVTLSMSTFEKVFNLPEARGDWVARFLKPKMASLAAAVEADMISRAVLRTPNVAGAYGTPITSMQTLAEARAKMQRFLAPASDRYALISDSTNIGLVNANKGLFNPALTIAGQYKQGALTGMNQGADFYEVVNLPAVANSARTNTTVNGAAQTGSVLTVATTTTAPAVGEVFTIAGVFAVHPLTGTAYGSGATDLQQFVVLPGSTATALNIYPAITPAMPNKTVSNSPANGAAVTFLGAASTSYRQNLMFQADAFTVAMMPLPIIASCEGYTYSAKGFSMRVMTFGNGQTDTESTRIDVLCTLAAVRGIHAARITE